MIRRPPSSPLFPTRRSSDLLGVAYKKNVDDPRESPALEILEILKRRGAFLSYNDPYIPVIPPMRHHKIRLESETLTEDRKSTRLNSSHVSISYAVFCLKKKK